MSGFVGKKERTEEYDAAVEALRRLLKAAGTDHVTRAYAEAVGEQQCADWAQRHGLRQSGGHQCIQRLTGKCRNDFGCAPPGGDHMSLWIKDGRPEAFVSQPYGLGWDALLRTVAYCQQNGLEVSIDAYPAWHFPGAVLTVVYKRAKKDDGGTTR